MRGQRGESRTWNSSSDWSLNQAVTYTYEDGTNGTLAGRPNGYTSTPTSALWAYDNAGRLSQISNPQNSNSTFTYGYRYTLNSGLHEGITTPGQGTESPMPFTLNGPQVNTSLAYETTRNALAFRRNDLPGGTLSKFAYGLNDLGQRVGLTPTGSAFATTTPLSWGYNATGEVTKADSSVNTHDRAYSYDGIGNRLQGSAGVSPASVTTYTPNALNQYSSITDPQSTIHNPVHDDDGNLTSGPVPGANGLLPGVPVPANAALTWDAENRLVKAVVNSTTVHYDYDHQSRLIARIQGSITTRYLYDGWNRIAGYESNGTGHTLKNTYLWGMDMSGSMQGAGAGGVGGLLSVSQISQSPIPNVSSYYPTYDGNGNVSEYVDDNGDKVAHFEYDPFGNLTVDSESNAGEFAYRFSTKPQDAITGLYYYGYRYYDPLTGRWPCRDPIEEKGGVNLYGFVRNDEINNYDQLGLFGLSKDHPAEVPPFDEEGQECDVPEAELVSLSVDASFDKTTHTKAGESVAVTFWIKQYKINGIYLGPHWAWETCLRDPKVQPHPDPNGEGDIPWGHNISPVKFMARRTQITELIFHFLSCKCEINPLSFKPTGRKIWTRVRAISGMTVEASETFGFFNWSMSPPATPSFQIVNLPFDYY